MRGRTALNAILLSVVGLAVSIFHSSGASANYPVGVSVQKDKDNVAHVVVNGVRAVTLRTSNGSLAPVDRAEIVAQRLSGMSSQGIDPKTVWYKDSGADSRVMIGESLLVIATQTEARAHSMKPVKLAEKWVQNLRAALAVPPLSAEPTSLTVPLGETGSVTVRSLLESPVQVGVSDPAVIAVDGSQPGLLVVMGVGTGTSTITLRSEDHAVTIAVVVKKYAAVAVPNPTPAVVTGWNAPAALVSKTAGEAAVRSISVEPRARVLAVKPAQPDRPLPPGQAMSVPVEVSAGGADYIPTKLSLNIRVENRVLQPAETAWIMYSNHPERVERFQTLFAGRLSASGENVRLLYHHQNMMQQRIGFVVDLINPSSSPAAVHVVEGVSRPILDTVVVGYLAGLEFMENRRNGIGRVIELPPGTRQVVVSQSLESPHTASGIVDFRALSGDSVIVRVLAKPDSQRQTDDVPGMLSRALGVDESKMALSDHVYPGPIRDMAVTYTIGKPWVFVRIGKEHLKHATQDILLYGNYGVTYNIDAKVENPLDSPQTVEVAFEATAGPASGLFVLDGNMIRIKQMRASAEMSLGKFTVPAGKAKSVSIQTMPLSGSAYPATIIIRAVSPVASAASSQQDDPG